MNVFLPFSLPRAEQAEMLPQLVEEDGFHQERVSWSLKLLCRRFRRNGNSASSENRSNPHGRASRRKDHRHAVNGISRGLSHHQLLLFFSLFDSRSQLLTTRSARVRTAV
ncbi:MAG: hypothetical protein OXG74_16115 [Acidobacteria bacterium]|nr:hypothetical protein [Acidobacteriota bacterium]